MCRQAYIPIEDKKPLISSKVVIWIRFLLIIVPLVLLGTYFLYGDDCKTPKQLSVEYEDKSILVTWDATHDKCNFTYLLRYILNNGQQLQTTTTASSYRIPNVDACFVLQLNLWTIDTYGKNNSDYISLNYTGVQRNARINDLKFSKVARGVQATWSKPAKLVGCDVFYEAEYTTEFYTSPRIQIYSGDITVPAESFCLQFTLRIDVRVDDLISSSAVIYYDDRDKLENVTLSVPHDDSNTLVVAWSGHSKQELCFWKYDVLYTPNKGEIQRKRVANPEANFSFAYCDKANIFITIIGPNSTTSGSTTTIEATQYPNIARVTDLNIVTNLESISLSWAPSPAVGVCKWDYEVKFWTDLGNFTYTVSASSIEFHGNSYCFFIEVGVRTIYDANHFSEMTRNHIKYELEPVRNLTLLEQIKYNVLTIAWTGHRKEEQCNIQYHVVYEYGIVQEKFTTSLTIMDFAIVYDVTIHIRVKAVSGDRESEENTITHVTPRPSAASWESFGGPDYFHVMLITVVLQFLLK